jgi:hexosaminidase
MKSFVKAAVIPFLFVFMGACQTGQEEAIPLPGILPKPQQIEVLDGHFTFDSNTSVFVDNDFKIAEDFLRNYMLQGVGFALEKANVSEANVRFEKDTSLPSEGYLLDISEENITIKASDASGAFYAVQTIRQLLPADMERQLTGEVPSVSIRQARISDFPKFKYRGMHLDVARHFFPKEFIKEYIANLSMLKMNYFHWHLTEDQGWRIEIKQYPKLTTHAAYRDETLIGHYNTSPQEFDGKRYGGFYTQEDIKEIVAFAAEHNVTIIPEIEMPGHAQAAISAYPELGCTGQQVPVATKWGVFEDIYCPKEETFVFLKNVLTEVMELFPGEYIHIGGDEAPKKHWKECGHCQKLIKNLGLKDEHELQSYFIKEIETFVNSKGKKIIGWDEILEGGLAPNATVMSWRGTEGAVEAAREGHDVILTPGSHAYFDHYQAENGDEPLAIGGFLPLKKVYSFNPIPEELTAVEAQFVLGAQGNVWTEYMPTTDQVEYMAFPRMLAMSEVVWKGPTQNLETDYPEFLSRVEPFMKRMDALAINYANHLYDVSGKVLKRNDSIFYELKTPIEGKKIVYTTNLSSEEKTYDSPVPILEDTRLEATVVSEGGEKNRTHTQTIMIHKGITGTISLNVEPHPAYGAGGKEALINGISGSDNRYGDKEWLGFWGDDLDLSIDLGSEMKISRVSTRFYNAPGQWIYPPKAAYLWVTLANGFSLKLPPSEQFTEEGAIVSVAFQLPENPTAFLGELRLEIPNYGIIAKGRQGAGNKAWTFIDEIIIE